jgi:hypothetical protein
VRRTASYAALGALAIPIAFPILVIIILGGSALSSPAAACGPDVNGTSPTDEALDPTQMSVAVQVVAAVRAFPPTENKPHAAVIALATARQESDLRNLDYGDRDSLGVFQQRSSQGWGTPDQEMNVAHATTTFLQHLIRVPEWETRRVTDVAADVQRPAAAYRGAYQQWVPLATRLTNEIWPVAAVPSGVQAGCGLSPASDPGPADATATLRAQSWVDANVPYNQGAYFTNQYGTYRQDCSGYVSMAWGLPTSLTTYSLPGVAHQISKDQLRAGDIMLKPGHVVVFDKWANPEHTAYWDYEEQYPGTVAVHHIVPYPYWPGQGTFRPYRKD